MTAVPVSRKVRRGGGRRESHAGEMPAAAPKPRPFDAAQANGLSSSAFIAMPRAVADDRPHGRRLLLALLVIAIAAAIAATTRAKLWPRLGIFEIFYVAHDKLYLTAKGWLWTAWFPWSLMLWLPALVVALFSLYGWITGNDLTRGWHRWVVLRLVGHGDPADPAALSRGARFLERAVRGSASLGLGTGFVTCVVENSRRELLGELEAALVEGRVVSRAGHADAAHLIHLDARLATAAGRIPADEIVRHAIADLALISHCQTAAEWTTPPGQNRLNGLMLASANETAPGANASSRLRRAAMERQSVAPFTQIARDRADEIEAWANAIDRGHWPAGMPDEAARFAGLIGDRLSFALFAQVDMASAQLALSTLAAVERLLSALTLGPVVAVGRSAHPADLSAHRDLAAMLLRRSRARLTRRLTERRWCLPVDDDGLGLWPKDSHLFWSIEGSALAAGGA